MPYTGNGSAGYNGSAGGGYGGAHNSSQHQATPAPSYPGYTGTVPSQGAPQVPPMVQGYLQPPKVPSFAASKGKTSVSTDALADVAANMGTLATVVQQVNSLLSQMRKLAPGSLFESYELRDKVGYPGDGTTTSLIYNYGQSLQDLSRGLSDVRDGLNKMRSTYKSFDDLNKAKIQDLENDFANAEADFTSMMTDNGGSAPTSYPSAGQTIPPTTTTGGSGNSKGSTKTT